jgi:transglutaminase-like putative cysteine protease
MPSFSHDRLKAYRLDRLCQIDATQQSLRTLAQLLWQAAGANGERYLALAHAIARDCIAFQSDTARTGGEDIAGITREYTDPLEALKRGVDDCDAKARLLVALLKARNFEANLVKWWDPTTGELAHVAAEVFWRARWCHLETILSRARFGDEPNDVPFEADGKWRYS